MRTEAPDARSNGAEPQDGPAEIAQALGVDVATHGSLTPTKMPQQPGWLRSNVGRWVIAITASTAPLTYFDIQHELRRSGSSSVTWSVRRKRGEVISLREARRIALQILAETEERLLQDRAAEARLLVAYWPDEDIPGA